MCYAQLRLIYLFFCVGLIRALAKVEIVENPKNATVIEGQDVILPCTVLHVPGNEREPVQWTRNKFGLGRDRQLSKWSRYSLVGDVSIGNYNLLIENAELEDDGWYECQVTEHEVRSKRAKLTVLMPPKGPSIVGKKKKEFTEVEVVLGKTIELKCEAFRAKPPAKLNWYTNGTLIPDVSIFTTDVGDKTFNTSATLRLLITEKVLHSKYWCLMTNGAMEEKVATERVQFKLIVPPKVTISLPTAVHQNSKAVVNCLLDKGSTATSYRWYINGTKQKSESSSFEVKPLSRSWNGAAISCCARNKAGLSNIASDSLNVLYPPVFLGGNTLEKVDINNDVTLQCHWDSNPEPLVEWTREGSDQVLARGSRLELSAVVQSDSGTYTCHANTKSVGSNLQLYKLVVEGPPAISSKMTQYALIGNTASIVCSINTSPGINSVTWTWNAKNGPLSLHNSESIRIGESIKYQGEFDNGSSVATLKIFNLNENDLHSYNCKVINSYGFRSGKIELERNNSSRNQQQVSLGLILILIGAIATVVIISALVYIFRCRKKKKGKKNGTCPEENVELSVSESASPPQNEACYRVGSSSSSSRPGTSASSGTPVSGRDDGYGTDGHVKEGSCWNQENNAKSKELFVNIDHEDVRKPLIDCSIPFGNDRMACGDEKRFPSPFKASSVLQSWNPDPSFSGSTPSPDSVFTYPYPSPCQPDDARTTLGWKRAATAQESLGYFRVQDDSSRSSFEKDQLGYPHVDSCRMIDIRGNTGRASELSHASVSTHSSAPSQQYNSKQATRV